jgi:8-oxo-dGTP pyrophosphatase MutT (NUDIX family)
MKKVVLYVIADKHNVLAVSRKNNHKDFGLPGGKVEYFDESLEEAVVREVNEELTTVLLPEDVLKVSFSIYHHDGEDYEVHAFVSSVHMYGSLTLAQAYAYLLSEWNDSGFVNDEGALVKVVDWPTLFTGSFGDHNQRLYTELLDKGII